MILSFNLSSEEANATTSFAAKIAPITPEAAVPTPKLPEIYIEVTKKPR